MHNTNLQSILPLNRLDAITEKERLSHSRDVHSGLVRAISTLQGLRGQQLG
jgi:hypothetical protein